MLVFVIAGSAETIAVYFHFSVSNRLRDPIETYNVRKEAVVTESS